MDELERIQRSLQEQDAQPRPAQRPPLTADNLLRRIEHCLAEHVDPAPSILKAVANYLDKLPPASRLYASEAIRRTLAGPPPVPVQLLVVEDVLPGPYLADPEYVDKA